MTSSTETNELAEFIAQTLSAIAAGITSSGVTKPRGPLGSDAFRMPSQVQFDVAVTAKHTSESGGSLKIQVFGAGLGVGGKDGAEAQTVSRVQFTVPWQYENVFDQLGAPNSTKPSYDRHDELKVDD